MKLLADENIHTDIVQWLRSSGHDVRWAAEEHPSEPDRVLLSLANSDGRVLVTADKDFGELVFHRRLSTAGTILLRLEMLSIRERLQILATRWPSIEARSCGHFVTVGRRKTRVRPISG